MSGSTMTIQLVREKQEGEEQQKIRLSPTRYLTSIIYVAGTGWA